MSEKIPWIAAKIGFEAPTDCLSEDVFSADREDDGHLPDGWSLSETYFTPIAAVAIFEVEVFPTSEDGQRVAEWVSKIKPRDEHHT